MPNTSLVGNFIKPELSTLCNGAQPEATTREKPEKGRRGHHDSKRYWRGSARRISWRPVCVLRWALHSRPWRCICILELKLLLRYRDKITIAVRTQRRYIHLVKHRLMFPHYESTRHQIRDRAVVLCHSKSSRHVQRDWRQRACLTKITYGAAYKSSPPEIRDLNKSNQMSMRFESTLPSRHLRKGS